MFTKRLLGLFFFGLFTCFTTSVFSEETSKISVEFITDGDFVQEKQLYIKFFSYLYKDIAEDLGLNDFEKDLDKRFETMKSWIQNESIGVRAIRVKQNDKVVAFVPFYMSTSERCCLWGATIDMTCENKKEIVETLKEFVFCNIEKIEVIEAITLKKSKKEQAYLIAFGFAECEINSEMHDPVLYTCFQLKKDK